MPIENNLTWNEVKAGIRGWNTIREQSDLLKPFFAGENKFEIEDFELDNIPLGELHFYPAIINGSLILFVIKATDDKFTVFEQGPNTYVSEYIKIAARIPPPHVQNTTPNNRIKNPIGMARIENWNMHHDQWIDLKAPNGGLFEAFALNATHIGLNTDLFVSFALKGTYSPFDFTGDLIFEDGIGESKFYDTTRPVPPYGQGLDAKENFFLLTASTS